MGLNKINTIYSSPKAILADKGKIWCGASARLYLVSPTELDTLPTITKNQRITALSKDYQSNLWIGGIEGIYCIADSFKQNWGQIYPELYSRIIGMIGDELGYLWIVTPENGLLRAHLRNGKIIDVDRINDIIRSPIKNIQNIYRDNNGNIWLATNTGIYSLNPKNYSLLHFGRAEGLPSDDIRSIAVSGDSCWAATSAGAVFVNIKKAFEPCHFPTYITDFQYLYNNEKVEISLIDSVIIEDRHFTIPPGANALEMHFTGMDYRRKGSMYFMCITTEYLPPLKWWTKENLSTYLKGKYLQQIDTSWIYKNTLDFGVKMKPGNYKIQIKAYSSEDTFSPEFDECSILILPMWYDTVWFSIFMWVSGIYALWHIYLTQAKLREMVIAVAHSRLIALQVQINPHFIGNTINGVQGFFYPPNPKAASRYTAIFTRLMRQSLDFSENTFIPFGEELKFIIDYMELVKARLGNERFRYSITGAQFVSEDIPFPALFLQPILENATIHGISKGSLSEINIHFFKSDRKLHCIITDNGPGIEATLSRKDKTLKRKSKGIKIIMQKAVTLNQLFNLDMNVLIEDLKYKGRSTHGTKVSVTFLIGKVMDFEYRQSRINQIGSKFIPPSGKLKNHEANQINHR